MTPRLRRACQCGLLGALVAAAVPAVADSADSLAQTLWAEQRAILEYQRTAHDGREHPRVSPHYLGWPPGAATPLGAGDIRSFIPTPGDEGYRCDAVEMTGFTHAASTGLLYWNTRCTDGTDAGRPAFQYASAAVWLFDRDGWVLFAQLGRRKPAREALRYDESSGSPESSRPHVRPTPTTVSAAAAEHPDARDALWAAELEILAQRGQNDFGPYLRYASPHYLAWPPDVPRPMDLDILREMIPRVSGLENERKTQRFAGYAQRGNTAVIYWHSHRTRTRSGAVVDQHNATTGVWTFEDGEWRLLGVLSRRKSPAVLAQ